jgi:quinol monooxygenase YgiN
MSVRLVVSITAKPGKGAELAKAFDDRAKITTKEDGCLQFEIFRGLDNPDRMVLLELWRDQAALDVHAQLLKDKFPALAPELRQLMEREDYTYTKRA